MNTRLQACAPAVEDGFWRVLNVTHSACSMCRAIIPAKVMTDGRDVYLRKFCPDHGEEQHRIRSDVADYLRTQRYIKPAWLPKEFAGDRRHACPDGCGLCARHEQHLCMPIVEITDRCNLTCPICINASGTDRTRRPAPRDMSVETFRAILDAILRAERQIDVLNISGGEPLLHPDLLALADEALSREGIVRVSISTNGLLLASQPVLIAELKKRDIVIALQHDGQDDETYRRLRGQGLRAEKEHVLDLLGEAGITTTLTMTMAGGVNEGQLPAMLELLFGRDHIVSLMLQPIAFTGRAASMAGPPRRLSIPDVIALLDKAGRPDVHAADFVPLPCSHPLCFSLAFYLALENGRTVPVSRLTDAATMMDSLANRMFFGLAPDEHERLKHLIYELWSGPAGAVPDSPAVLATLRRLMREISACNCEGFNPRRSFASMERSVKSIFIHAFQDADTFDLARVRRCCQSYPQPDGTIIPACVFNVLRRERFTRGKGLCI